MHLGEAIKDIRVKKKISQGSLAETLEISQSYLSQVERGRKKPSLELLEKISKKLEIPVFYFMLNALDVDVDIKEGKRDSYRQIRPIINSMVEKFFIEE